MKESLRSTLMRKYLRELIRFRECLYLGGGAIKSSGGSDLKNTPFIYVEAKRTEKFKIHESMRQVEENIEISKSKDMPVVITRRNREITGNSLCVLRLDNFLQLYELLIKSKE